MTLEDKSAMEGYFGDGDARHHPVAEGTRDSGIV